MLTASAQTALMMQDTSPLPVGMGDFCHIPTAPKATAQQCFRRRVFQDVR
jgi:hypothetical protein